MPQARKERLHPDHQRRVYIYPARIISAPMWLEEQASLYGECWNALADALHSALLPIWREENARRAGIETLPEDERRDAYRALDRELRPRCWQIEKQAVHIVVCAGAYASDELNKWYAPARIAAARQRLAERSLNNRDGKEQKQRGTGGG